MTTLRCLGAAGTVTGSKHLLEVDVGSRTRRILVDCGLFQGLKKLRLKNWRPLPVEASSIDTVVLTHAHIDHTGYLPRLVREGFEGRVVATRATADLAEVLLRDSGHLQEEEARYHNKKKTSKHHPALPLYTAEEGAETAARMEGHGYDRAVDLGDGISMEYRIAGHILGSAFVRIELPPEVAGDGPRTFLFSGDIGPRDGPLHPPAAAAGPADVVVVESTYGDRLHTESDVSAALAAAVHRAIERRGPLIIPAFAVARTQTLVYLLAELEKAGEIPRLPVYQDSPMAINATEIYRIHGRELREDAREDLMRGEKVLRTRDFHLARTPEQSKRINSLKGTFVLISASGMATGGRILHHLVQRVGRPETTVLFAGYQAVGTRGWRLQQGEKSIRIFGRDHRVEARIETLHGLSAHGDRDDLMAWLRSVEGTPRRAFVVHGEPEPAAALARSIGSELGWDAVVPRENRVYEL